MIKKSLLLYILGLCAAFIVLVIVGNYIVAGQQESHQTQQQSSADQNNQNQTSGLISTSTNSSNQNISISDGSQTASSSQDSSNTSKEVVVCTARLKTATEVKHTKYEKGTILVRVAADVSFSDAQALVARYRLTIQDETTTVENYPSLHLLTLDVPKDTEFINICLLKKDPSIRAATLNTLFALHE